MSEPEIIDISSPTTGGNSRSKRPAVVLSSVQHPLTTMEPHTLELPSTNWLSYMESEKSLLICEMITPAGRTGPCVRKHVNVDVTTGICISYVMGLKISEVLVMTKTDVEQCIEELEMLDTCVGGQPATKYPPSGRSNAIVDPSGNWRHRSCRLAAAWLGVPCNACESLEYEFQHPPNTSNLQAKSSEARVPKAAVISHLSHRKQSQIVALRKQRLSWYRRRKKTETEIKRIDEMISQISKEEPEIIVELEDDD